MLLVGRLLAFFFLQHSRLIRLPGRLPGLLEHLLNPRGYLLNCLCLVGWRCLPNRLFDCLLEDPLNPFGHPIDQLPGWLFGRVLDALLWHWQPVAPIAQLCLKLGRKRKVR
jgi:hypothetical protein